MKGLFTFLIVSLFSLQVLAETQAVKLSVEFSSDHLTTEQMVELEAVASKLSSDEELEIAFFSEEQTMQVAKSTAKQTIEFLMDKGVEVDQISFSIETKALIQ